ncbi:MAG TPA: PrgI family protein [Candidatus Fimivivens sp.]|nr:PrgI family protein [Candidatus Fimivivens sp.]
MMFNVPQFIDVEDKVAGPLTAKQLFWMIGMGAAIMLIVSVFPGAVAYVIAVPVVIVFVLFAFYRPNGQPLIAYAISAFFFLFHPKVLMWRRPLRTASPIHERPTTEGKESARARTVTADEIRRVAAMMDKR